MPWVLPQHLPVPMPGTAPPSPNKPVARSTHSCPALGEARGAFLGGRRAGLGGGSRGKRRQGAVPGTGDTVGGAANRRSAVPAAWKESTKAGTEGQELCPGMSLPRSDVSNSGGFGGSCRIPPRAGSSAALPGGKGRSGSSSHPLGAPTPIPLQSQWGHLAYSRWRRWCQVLAFIPGNDERGSRSPSLEPRAAPAPQGERLLPSPLYR